MREYFTKLYGNESTKKRLANAIENGTLPHAFLIDGETGSGKTTLALEIASALNCENADDDSHPLPCGICNNCRKIKDDGFVDVKTLRCPADKASIGVGQVKNFRSDMLLSSTESNFKIYIIDDAEKLTTEAQNALLIVLEEPPRNVFIFLLASGTDKILTTIKSRTQYIAMSRFSSSEIFQYLKKKIPPGTRDQEKYEEAAISADGRIGRALTLLEPRAFSEEREKRNTVIEFLKAIGRRTPYTVLYNSIMTFPTKRPELCAVLEGIITALRDMIAVKKTQDISPLFFASVNDAKEFANEINFKRLLKIYDIINQTHIECTRNANVNALLTVLAAKIKLT